METRTETPVGTKRGIWTAICGEHRIGFLVTEAWGRLAEPVAYIHVAELYGQHEPLARPAVHYKTARAMARAIAVDPGQVDRYSHLYWKPSDLRAMRGNWTYPLIRPFPIYFYCGPFVGWYSRGAAIVKSRDGTDPDPAPTERLRRIIRKRGKFLCPHCENSYRYGKALADHLRRKHFDGLTASYAYTLGKAVA